MGSSGQIEQPVKLTRSPGLTRQGADRVHVGTKLLHHFQRELSKQSFYETIWKPHSSNNERLRREDRGG